MASKQKTQTGAKVKKKTWVSLVAPKMFNEQIVGEAPVYNAADLVGKTVNINLMTLTGDARKQSVSTRLKIFEVKEGKAYTKIERYEMNPSAIKRLVRRKRERLDESLVYATKDGVKIRMKPFILTISLTRSSVVSELRKRLKMFLYKTASQNTYDDLFRMVIDNKLQKEVGMMLSKTYPIKNVEMRVMHLEKNEARITPPPLVREKIKEEEDKSEDDKEAAPEKSEKSSKEE